MKKKVIVAGGTGWAGSALCRGIIASDHQQLTAAVSRSAAGNNLNDVLGTSGPEIPVFGSIGEALANVECEVVVEYTKPHSAKTHVLSGLEHSKHVVIGTSGLTNTDFEEIDYLARKQGCSVLAAGNFAMTAVLLQKFAEMAARYIPNFEIIDYAHAGKIDAPSGTVRELANRLSAITHATQQVPLEDVRGETATRGARMGGVQVHAVRLPGHVISVEAIFGQTDERLSLRHDAGSGAEPYVAGALVAIDKAGSFSGLRRGLDTVLEF